MHESKSQKPKFFSKEGFKHFISAFNVKQYSPRDWAIWSLSSVATYVNVAVMAGLKMLYSMVPAGIKIAGKNLAVKVWVTLVTTFNYVVN